MSSHTLCRKKVYRQLNYRQIMGIYVLKRHSKSSSSELNKIMGVRSWIYPKPGLKVARKLFHRKFVSQKYRWKLYTAREIGLKNAYKISQNAFIASRNVPNMYTGLFIYVQSNEK